MKTAKWIGLTAIGWLVSTTALLSAVETVSESFVASATVITGNAGAAARVTAFSLPMVGPICAAGSITALGSNTLVDANANWLPNQFNGQNGSFYVEFDSGLMTDIAAADAATKTLTIHGDVRPSIAAGAAYRIRKHLTVAGIFGANNEAGLFPELNEAAADNILLYCPQSQNTVTIFCLSLFNEWYNVEYAPAGNFVIYPEQGILIRRKVPGNLVLYLHGQAKEGPTQVPVFTGLNLVGTVKARKAFKLSDLNLYTGNPATGMAADINYQLADNLRTIKPDGTTSTFFYYPDYGWVDFNYNLSDQVVIPAGSAFFIVRKAPRGFFSWTIPPE